MYGVPAGASVRSANWTIVHSKLDNCALLLRPEILIKIGRPKIKTNPQTYLEVKVLFFKVLSIKSTFSVVDISRGVLTSSVLRGKCSQINNS